MGERLKDSVHVALSRGVLAEVDRRTDSKGRSEYIERVLVRHLAATVDDSEALRRLAHAVIRENDSGHDWPEWIELVALARDVLDSVPVAGAWR